MTTLNSTVGRRSTSVWVGVEGDDFVIGHRHLPTYQSDNSRGAYSSAIREYPVILSDATTPQGLREYLVGLRRTHALPTRRILYLLQRLGRLSRYVARTQSSPPPPCAIFRLDHANHNPGALWPVGRVGCANLRRMRPQTCPMMAGHVA